MSVELVLDFLTNLMHGGTGYSCKNTAKYAIGSYTVLHDGKLIKDDQLVARFMKGMFNLKPPRPRYADIWDVGKVLDYIRSLPLDSDILLHELTLKLCLLILLISAQRIHTLHVLRIDMLVLVEDSANFVITDLLNQSRPGYCGANICLREYPHDRRICVVTMLKQ